ncbi:Shedu anti-phage system protein SduA domain-containing protein [Flavobacterium chilense]|uniref:Shedu protein SduA C-terminal domain-containing protein n=1 Tax=Flavobacterium chilense TaxID=946677 RepID=A0A1M7IQL6_9FLAO|nr:Shedu anti-phage system protein SduA domain-containing protein [Flavobacterium chilense]SHM42923.1 protein of unknown function [Flavobacterium chilense]
MKKRLDNWKNKKKIDLLIDDTKNKIIANYLKSINYNSDVLNSNFALIENAKELIFDVKNNTPKIHVISTLLCLETFQLKYDHILDITFESYENENVFDNVKDTLALALAIDVPVYPNTSSMEKELSKYYKSILETGFTAPDNEGRSVKLKATNSKEINDFKVNNLKNIDLTKFWSALDVLLLKENLQEEFLKLNNAYRTLNYLEVAISKLEIALINNNRNENELQSILTENPILFGIEYSKILPKHRLGSEYEIDYALEQFSGVIDVVEIESSNLKLYTKQGNPTKELVHAEQQVIDWINWIEKNNSYANSKINGFISPKAFVIIGRNSDLTEKNKESLIRRNRIFNGIISVLTYDDLLIKAKTMLEILNK